MKDCPISLLEKKKLFENGICESGDVQLNVVNLFEFFFFEILTVFIRLSGFKSSYF